MNLISWSWESGFVAEDKFWYQLGEAVNDFISFHGAESLNLGNLQKKYIKCLREYINPEIIIN